MCMDCCSQPHLQAPCFLMATFSKRSSAWNRSSLTAGVAAGAAASVLDAAAAPTALPLSLRIPSVTPTGCCGAFFNSQEHCEVSSIISKKFTPTNICAFTSASSLHTLLKYSSLDTASAYHHGKQNTQETCTSVEFKLLHVFAEEIQSLLHLSLQKTARTGWPTSYFLSHKCMWRGDNSGNLNNALTI
jgi:hypothetical protein